MKILVMVASAVMLAGCMVKQDMPAPSAEETAALAYIQEHVQAMWFRPVGDLVPKKAVTVDIRLDETGRVEETTILKSSGNATFDAKLLEAIRRAAPFPIPEGSREKFQRIIMDFNG